MADPDEPARAPGEPSAPGETRPSGEGAAPAGEGYEPRGVENPRIVDLIAPDPEEGEVVLVILEGRLWAGGRAQLAEHEEKLDSYFAYVLDGHLAKQYPQYADLPVRIELRCADAPGELERPFLAAAARFAASQGMRFVVEVDPDPFGRSPAPWER